MQKKIVTLSFQAVHQQNSERTIQSSTNDSLGIISLQSNTTQSQGILFPYVPAQSSNSQQTGTESQPTVTLAEEKNSEQTLVFPYAVHSNEKNLDFSVSLFEYGDSVDFTNKLQKTEIKEFTQEVKEKVFVINYKQINETTNNWMFWLLLGVLVLFGWSRLFYKKQLDLLLSSVLHYNFAIKSIRNTSENSQSFSNILQFIFSVNIALFSYQIFNYFSPTSITGIKAIGIVLAVCIGFLLMYGIKDFLYRMLGFVFNEPAYTYEYLFNVHLYNRVLGIFLFPVVISFAFVQKHVIDHKLILYAGALLIITFFIFRIIRGIQISIKANVSILYMFLYFCTLEILPIAVLVKVGTLVLNKF